MESEWNSIELGILNEVDIEKIKHVNPICECSLLFNNHNNPSKPQHLVFLQLRADYVLQVHPISKTILSGFQCDYSINFEIIRSPPKAPMTLGSPIQLEFTFTNNNNKKICFFVEDPQKLEFFGSRLEKKYIVQLGFRDLFKAIKILGKGVTATVYKASQFRDQIDVAIKSFKRSVYFANENGKLSFQKEFKILSLLHHRHVCFLEGVYETENSTYIVMENLALSLFGWIQKYGFPSFDDARKMMFHLLKGIEHLHSKGIMHRDLKLENIMVRRDSKENVEIVIVDMGLAEFTNAEKYLYTRCGTPGYVAPEILKAKSGENERYNESCDIFSLGVIFHVLFFKKSLFEGSEVKEVIKKNTECNINFDAEYFSTLCSDGLDLIKRMLEKDPTKRITATEALNHEFNKPINISESVIKMGNTLQSINNIV